MSDYRQYDLMPERVGWYYRFPDYGKLAQSGFDWTTELRYGEFAEFTNGAWVIWFKPETMLAENHA